MRFVTRSAAVLILVSSCVAAQAQGIPSWQASAEALGAGFLATNINAPEQQDIGAYDTATGGGVTYEFIFNVPEVMGASSAFMGSLGAPAGDSAGLKFDQWPNSGTYGATAFGVADYTGTTAHTVGADTHIRLCGRWNGYADLCKWCIRGNSRRCFVCTLRPYGNWPRLQSRQRR